MIIGHATPESHGISSVRIAAYVQMLEDQHLAMHDILIARGNEILCEIYYPPFHCDFAHRLYSVTKSFVALAIGFAWQDGLLSLDDPMSKYFSRELEVLGEENNSAVGLHMQTVRNMLMMSTAKTAQNWFAARTDDRVGQYFSNPNPAREPGEIFEYDSSGTFVLGALAERLTGKTLMDYLREKLFDKIGISDRPFALQCPGGHTWGDSAFLMPPTDLFRAARFVLNGGSWMGEQLLDAGFIRDAVSPLISTGNGSHCDENGYGYYIWHAYGDGFFFNGMGCQFALCIPEKDLIFICNADNQGNPDAKNIILDGFYEMVAAHTGDPLPEDPAAQRTLADRTAALKLFAVPGLTHTPMAEKVSRNIYTLTNNRMGMKWVSLTFDASGGIFAWENAQGKKQIPFGLCENAFADFPQEGYSNLIGSVPGERLLRGAYSGAWESEDTFRLKVQIIDDYFGNMDAYFSFSDDGRQLYLRMTKTAEDFLNEYYGEAEGTADS